jgi:EAL domain-containing protein (putative c-di-GMP-specific phosphodiesterase class I)
MHPTRGLLGPHEFIGFAEDHGLIAEIGTIVLDKARSDSPLEVLAADKLLRAVTLALS